MSSKIRVRFAPSPTGPLHMGGVRTALYNYLFARHHGGEFLLRIEDTDQNRFVEGAEEYIIEALTWCGLIPDEGVGFGGEHGPYRQSERKETGLYKTYADELIQSGNAYYAFDTPKELEAMRETLKKAGVAAPQYNAVTRSSMVNSTTLSAEEVVERLERGDPYVIRIKIPRNEEIKFHDIIRGWVVVHSSNLDDKVLFKSDGMPTYHLANIVDDHLMKISHVIRGEEWLPSAPLHVLLYRVLGWEDSMPEFAHLPLLLRPDGNGKLSKRDGDRLGFPVFPLEWKDPASGEISSGYREKGYYPEAFVNMLALLGWNPGTAQEIFSIEELVSSFGLDRVGKAGSKFDPDKTRWFNQHYLRAQSSKSLAEQFEPLLKEAGLETGKVDLEKFCEIMKERATFVSDLLEGDYFFRAPETYDESVIRKKWKENSGELLEQLATCFGGLQEFTSEFIENCFKSFIEEKELGMGAVLPLFRLIVTGKGMGPSMFDIAELIGKDETLKRMRTGIKNIAVHG
ncbi:MAG: glutamate--tRNA ligase [Vicingaceae bacterium]